MATAQKTVETPTLLPLRLLEALKKERRLLGNPLKSSCFENTKLRSLENEGYAVLL